VASPPFHLFSSIPIVCLRLCWNDWARLLLLYWGVGSMGHFRAKAQA
jgi:hypothetical protein